jgi:CelD/BcsL family acetyltransferase involved in cellulose biosynthesis
VTPLDRAGLESCAARYDAAVEADPGVDPFCTRTDWLLSFHDAFQPEREVVAVHAGGSYVVLAARGPVLEPLESMWSFASPLVGADSVELLAALLASRGRAIVYLAGLSLRDPRTRALALRLNATHSLQPVSATERFVAELDDLEGYLGRRSAKFRASARAALRRVRAAGVGFEPLFSATPAQTRDAYARVLAIERRSWKAATGNGVDRGPMRDFYAQMYARLAARGALRLVFAVRDGEDVGYLAGGIAGSTFRGLQFSFDERLRALGLGNALQLEIVARLAGSGLRSYDLGAQSPYKARWAEGRRLTVGILARPR